MRLDDRDTMQCVLENLDVRQTGRLATAVRIDRFNLTVAQTRHIWDLVTQLRAAEQVARVPSADPLDEMQGAWPMIARTGWTTDPAEILARLRRHGPVGACPRQFRNAKYMAQVEMAVRRLACCGSLSTEQLSVAHTCVFWLCCSTTLPDWLYREYIPYAARLCSPSVSVGTRRQLEVLFRHLGRFHVPNHNLPPVAHLIDGLFQLN